LCNSNIGLHWMTQKAPKSVGIYSCEKCDFVCSRKGDYNRHISTQKHKRMTLDYEKSVKSVVHENHECICGKIYKYRQGLYKHRLKCSIYLLEDTSNEIIEFVKEPSKHIVKEQSKDNDDISYKELVVQLMKDNKEMRDLLKEQQNQHNKALETIIPKIGNNNITTNNQQLNINLFLNEQCKHALNLSDFIHELPFNTNDLISIAEKGFVEGISQTFLEGLKRLSIYERPIHCTDKKRDVLYIKENDVWEKETPKHENMKRAIQKLKRRNMNELGNMIKNDDDISTNTHSQELSMKIIHSHVEGMEDGQEKNMDKIIKNVSKEVLLDKIADIK